MRRMIVFVVLFHLVAFTAGCSFSGTSSQVLPDSGEIPVIPYYKDIPGVTEGEIAAIERLKAERESLSYAHLNQAESFQLPDGTYAGFTIAFCDLLTEMFEMNFIHKAYEGWDDLIKALESGQADFTGGMTRTPKRLEKYYMSHPIAERALKIYTLADSPDFVTETDINGLKIGFFFGTINYEYINRFYPSLSFEACYFNNLSDAALQLQTGSIQAFVVDAVIDPMLYEYEFIKSKEFFPLVYTPVSLTTARPELEPIISVVSKYIASGGVDTLYELYKQGNHEYAKYKLYTSFTNEEKLYLESLSARGSVVAIGMETDNYPFSFYNEKDESFQGIAIDVLEEIGNLIDVRFLPAHGKDAQWSEILSMLREGKIPMVTQLLQTDLRRADFIWASIPYASSNYALLSKMDYPNIMPHQVVRTRVGLPTDTAYAEIYPLWFPDNDNATYYNSHGEAFAGLEKGEVDLIMLSDDILLYQTNYLEKPDYKVNILFSSHLDSYFGFYKNDQVLCSIIEKAQAYIHAELIEKAWTSKTFDYEKKMANERSIYLLILVLILLAVLAGFAALLLNTIKAKEEARIASKAKGAFLAHMSHEIRTPLHAIIGMSNIAKMSIDNKDKTLSSVNQIISSSHHLLSLLNNILDISKIESGKLEMSCEPFSLLESCRSAAEIISHSCTEKGVIFNTNIDTIPDIMVCGDRLRINQVLINLLGNAVKFTDSGGIVTLEIDVLQESEEEIHLNYSISDNGIGLSQEQIEKLFIPFEQTGSTIGTRFGGTGLGLSISQNLINMMGGEIKVKSRPCAGSTFYFHLHFKKGREKVSRRSENLALLNLTGKRILIAEDVEINRLIAKEILSPTGVQIDEACHGQQAIDIFFASPLYYYDLIFMDIQMPVMDGYEAAKTIRHMEREDAKTIPIIAMTANAYKEDRDLSFASGMNGHLSKPIDMDAMAKSLKEYIVLDKKAGVCHDNK